MKKILFLSGLLTLLIIVHAQDTVRYGDPWYAFNPLTIIHSSDSVHHYTHMFEHSEGYFFRQENPIFPYDIQAYANNNYVIYGFALTVDSVYMNYILMGDTGTFWDTIPFLDSSDTPRLLLYEKIDYHRAGNDILFYGTAACVIDTIGKIDTLLMCQVPLRQCFFDYHYGYDFVTHHPVEDESIFTSNCYEFYFDTPIELNKDSGSGITDTFYIGGLIYETIDTDTYRLQYGRSTRGGWDYTWQQP